MKNVSSQTNRVARPVLTPPTVDLNRVSQNFPPPAVQEKKNAGTRQIADGRFEYVDVLRGLAFLWVALHHSSQPIPVLNGLAHLPFKLLVHVEKLGWLGVSLFLVLSGFCLYLPLVRKQAVAEVRLDIPTFFKRRAARILPTYYISLALMCGYAMLASSYHRLPSLGPVPSVKDVLLHALLLHNLSTSTFSTINGVYWSLALECQLYVIFPLLVWLAARRGLPVLLGVTFAVSLAWQCIAYHYFGFSLEWSPNFVKVYHALPVHCFEFALGMCVAAWVTRPQPYHGRLAGRVGLVTAIAGILYASFVGRFGPMGDQLWGTAFACLLLCLAQVPASVFSRSRVLTALNRTGTFSYSLYVVHYPLLALLTLGLSTLPCFRHPSELGTVALTLVRIALIVPLGYGFYFLAEKPFLRKPLVAAHKGQNAAWGFAASGLVAGRQTLTATNRTFRSKAALLRSMVSAKPKDAALPTLSQQPTMNVKDALARVHLGFLDGLRGLAVLYVLFYHVRQSRLPDQAVSGIKGILTNWLIFGHLAVDVFIVLSGFCLMLPVARRGELTGGAVQFFKRRARRILPPFFAAVVFGLAMGAVASALHGHIAFAPLKTIAANLLLLQDVHPACNTINGVFWSVAVEWKIYFLFPVLVWVGRRWGGKAALAAALAIGYGVSAALYCAGDLYMVSNHIGAATLLCPWYVALFGLGMWASERAFGASALKRFDAPWKAGGVASMALLIGLLAAFPHRLNDFAYTSHWPIIDFAAGMAAALLLLWLSVACRQGTAQSSAVERVLRVLSWRPLVALGGFSYSIYLVHLAVLEVFMALTGRALGHGISPTKIDLCLVGLGIPVMLIISYGFFVLFERPFMSQAINKSHQEDRVTTKPLAIIYALLHIHG